MSEIERSSFLNLPKEKLVDEIFKLKDDLSKLHEDFVKVTNLRLYHLERNQNMHIQYGRRESFEIVGIPPNITDDKLEEVLDIVKEAKVLINRQPLKKSDICAVHRLKDKNTTICRVVNRKYATEAIFNGKNLKGTKRYGDGKAIFINPSLCPEFKFLNFVIRKAWREKVIHRYKIRNGVSYVQKLEDSDFVQIGHVLDLQNLGLTVPERKSYTR